MEGIHKWILRCEEGDVEIKIVGFENRGGYGVLTTSITGSLTPSDAHGYDKSTTVKNGPETNERIEIFIQ
jgi:hypothetical protein